MNSINSSLAAAAGIAASVSPPVVSIKHSGESLSNVINNNLNIKAKTDEDFAGQAKSVEIPNDLEATGDKPEEESIIDLKQKLNDAEKIETKKTETDSDALISTDSINLTDNIPVAEEISSEINKITKDVDVIDASRSDVSAPNSHSNDREAKIDVPFSSDKNASHKIASLKDNDNQVNNSDESTTVELVESEIKDNTNNNKSKLVATATSSDLTSEEINPQDGSSETKNAFNHNEKNEKNADVIEKIPNELMEKPNDDTGEDDDDKGDDTLYIDEGNDQNENKQELDSDGVVKRHKDILDTDTEEEVEDEEDEDEKAFGVNIKDKKKKIKEAMGSKPVEKIDVEMFKSEWSDEEDNEEDEEKINKSVNQSDKVNTKTMNKKAPIINNTDNMPSEEMETNLTEENDNNDKGQDKASIDKEDSDKVHEDIDLDENEEDLQGIDKDIKEYGDVCDKSMDTTDGIREQSVNVPTAQTEGTRTVQGEHTQPTATDASSAPLNTSDNTEKTDSSLLDESLEENMLIEEISQDGEADETEVEKETEVTAETMQGMEVNLKEAEVTEREMESTEMVNVKSTEITEVNTEVTNEETEVTEVINEKQMEEENQLMIQDGGEESYVVIEAANGDNLADFVIVNEDNEEQEIYEEVAEDGTKTYYVKVRSTAIGQEDGAVLADSSGDSAAGTLKAESDDQLCEASENQQESEGPPPLIAKSGNLSNLYLRKDQLSGKSQDEIQSRLLQGRSQMIHKKGRRGLNLYVRKDRADPVGRILALQQLESPELRRRSRNPPLPPSGVTLDQARGPKVQIKVADSNAPRNKSLLEKSSNLSKAKLEMTVQLRNAEKARALKRQLAGGPAQPHSAPALGDSSPAKKSANNTRPAAKTPLKNVNKPIAPQTPVAATVEPVRSQTPVKIVSAKKPPRVAGTPPSGEERGGGGGGGGGDATPSRKSTRLKIENQTLKDYAVEMPESYANSYTQSTTIVISKTPGAPGRPSKRKLAELKDYEVLGTPDTAATKRFMISYANTRRRPPYSMGEEEEGPGGSNPVIPPLIIENGKDIVDRLLSGEQRTKRRGRGAPSEAPEDLIIVEAPKKKKMKEFDASLIPSAREIEENHIVLGTEDLLSETAQLLSADDALPASAPEPDTSDVQPNSSPKPNPPADKPNQPSVKPNQPSGKSNQSADKPNQTSGKPNQPSAKSNQSADKPNQTSGKPNAASKRLARGLRAAAARVNKPSSPGGGGGGGGGSVMMRDVVKSIKAAKIPANTWNVETQEDEEERESEDGGSEEEAKETVLLDGDKKRQNKMMREINMLLGDEGAINMLYSMTQKRNRSESVESASSTSADGSSKSKRKSLLMRTRLVKSAVMNLSSNSEAGVRSPPAVRLRKSAFKSNNLPSIPKPPRKVSVDSVRSSLSESAASKSPRPPSLAATESVIFRRHSSDSSCSDAEETVASEGGATPSGKASTPLRSPQTPSDASRHLKSMIRAKLTSLTQKRRAVAKSPSLKTASTESAPGATPDALAEEKRTSTSSATSNVAGDGGTKKSTPAESGTKKTTSAALPSVAGESGTKKSTLAPEETAKKTASAALSGAAESGSKKKVVKRNNSAAAEKTGSGEGNVSVIEEVEQELETLFGGDTSTETVENGGDVPETEANIPTPVPQPAATSKPSKKKSKKAQPQPSKPAPVESPAEASEQTHAESSQQVDAEVHAEANAGRQEDADEVNVISVKICDDLAYITFLNQNKHNFFTVNILHELTATLVYLDRQDACKTILMMGAGFSSGVDLSYLLCDNRHKRRRNATSMANALKEFITTLSQLGKPILLGVRGRVVGAAVTVLPLFDFVLAAEMASFETLYPRLGQIPEAAATFTFPTFLGRNATSELLLNCKKISAAEAQSMNLVTRVCPDEAFEKTAELWAKDISKYSTQSMQTTKLLLRKDQYSQLNETLSTETDFLIEHWNSEEVQKNLKKHLASLQ